MLYIIYSSFMHPSSIFMCDNKKSKLLTNTNEHSQSGLPSFQFVSTVARLSAAMWLSLSKRAAVCMCVWVVHLAEHS